MRTMAVMAMMAMTTGCGTLTTKHVGIAFLAAGATAMGVSAATEGYELSRIEDTSKKPEGISNADWSKAIEGVDKARDHYKARLALGVGIGGVFALVGSILLGWDYIVADDGRAADPRNVLNPQ